MRYTIALICIVTLSGFLDPFADSVRKGNSAYDSGNFEQALDDYVGAEKYAPSEKSKDSLAFNQGAALYKAGRYDEAITSFERSIKTGNNELQKKAFFNIGNTYAAKGDYEHALEAYVNALKIDPDYLKAKRNIEYLFNEQKKQQDEKNQKSSSQPGNNDDQTGNDSDRTSADDKKQTSEESKNQTATEGQSQDQMEMTQVMNLLKSLKQRPVERKKGSFGERRLEKDW